MQKTIITERREQVISEKGQQSTFDNLQARINELVRENEELRQKSQVVVKKVETNIIEKKPGLDQETAEKIRVLEERLAQAERVSFQKVKEVEELRVRVVKMNDIESELDVLRNRNFKLEQQLNEKLLELEAIKQRFNDVNELYLRAKEDIDRKERDLLEIHRRVQELETLPNQIAAAQKNSQLLGAEVDRLTVLAKQRDSELILLEQRFKELEAQRCLAPAEHDELRHRLKDIEVLRVELDDIKRKYNALCSDYEKEISIVRTKDKEIAGISKELQANIKESRKALDKELSIEEKLERELEKLEMRLKEKQAEIDDWKKRAAVIPDLDKKVRNLESDYSKLDDKYRKLEEMNRQLVVKVDALNAELSNYRDSLKQREKAYAVLEKEKAALVAEFEKSQRQSSAILSKVTETKDTEIQTLTERTAIMNRDMIALQKELEALRGECDRLNAEKFRITKVLQEHTIQEKELFDKIEELKKQKEYLSKEIADLVTEKDRIKATAISKDKEATKLDKNVNQLANENARLLEIIADIEKKLANANYLLQERDTELRSLKDTLANIQRAHADLLKEREKLVLENATMVHRISELETSVTTITTKYTQLESIYNQIKSATKHLGQVHEQLAETCEDTEKLAHTQTQVTQTKIKTKEVQQNRF